MRAVDARAAQRRTRVGIAYAAAAYVTWGLFPVYFHALAGTSPLEILAHRIAWSAICLVAVITALRRWGDVVARLRAPGAIGGLALSATFISGNWLVYIWAVNAGRVLEASLGYFVNPLVTVLLGVAFLRDPLTRRQLAAIALAAVGVLSLVVRAGTVPWVALLLAITFAMYGLIRKRVRVDALAGLFGEVALLTPLALAYLAWLARSGSMRFGAGDLRLTLLLSASGVVTAVPLMWFAAGVSRLRLSTVGLLQYLNPTMQFAIAVFAFGERFTPAHAVAFGCIWASLALYTAEALAAARRLEASVAAPGAARAMR
jgi:chloramphenicol-sensitive protein RarD